MVSAQRNLFLCFWQRVGFFRGREENNLLVHACGTNYLFLFYFFLCFPFFLLSLLFLLLFCFTIMYVCHNSFRIALATISVLLAEEAQFVHKLDQFEFQLDRSQLPYSEHLGLVLQKAAQPSTIIIPQDATQQNTKKAPYNNINNFI